MTKRRNPVVQRREQIEREIAKIQNPKNIKKRNDFKSDGGFESWEFKRGETLRELYEELAIIEYPSEYFEVPPAVAAAELGLTLDEILEIILEKLMSLSSTGVSSAADRIDRDEIGRVADVGPAELLRRARLEIPELFLEAIDALVEKDVERARSIYDRIDRHDSCINPHALACDIGILFVSKNVPELECSIEFILKRDVDDAFSSIHLTQEMFSRLRSDSHVLEAIRERFLAIASGSEAIPFRNTFCYYKSTRFPSQMNDQQNLAIYIGDVVMDAIKRYKLVKWIESRSSDFRQNQQIEILRVVQNAVYTALEAKRSYSDSPMSKLFVDKYVGIPTRRRQAPELIELLPGSTRSNAKANGP